MARQVAVEVLALCEEFVPGDPPEFFFDRNPQNFGSILEIYRWISGHSGFFFPQYILTS